MEFLAWMKVSVAEKDGEEGEWISAKSLFGVNSLNSGNGYLPEESEWPDFLCLFFPFFLFQGAPIYDVSEATKMEVCAMKMEMNQRVRFGKIRQKQGSKVRFYLHLNDVLWSFFDCEYVAAESMGGECVNLGVCLLDDGRCQKGAKDDEECQI